jgi:hypothetical protein
MNPFWWAWTFNRILKNNTLEQNITALGNCLLLKLKRGSWWQTLQFLKLKWD